MKRLLTIALSTAAATSAYGAEELGSPSEAIIELKAGYVSLPATSMVYSAESGFRVARTALSAPHADLSFSYRSEYGFRFFFGAPAVWTSVPGSTKSKDEFVLGDAYLGLSIPIWHQISALPGFSIGLSGTAPTGRRGLFGGDSISAAANAELTYDLGGRVGLLIGGSIAGVLAIEHRRDPQPVTLVEKKTGLSNVTPAVAAYAGLTIGLDNRHRLSATVGAAANGSLSEKGQMIIEDHKSLFVSAELSRYNFGRKQIGLAFSAHGLNDSPSYWAHLALPLNLK